MRWLVLKSWALLLYLDCAMHLRSFKVLHRIVRRQEVRSLSAASDPAELVCKAVDLACAFYFKRVLCLQRSAATTLLLRQVGKRAELVIGAQLVPFRSHAWVEIGGHVINDKPYLEQIFQVLERV